MSFPLSAMAARPVVARAAAGQPKEPAPPGPSWRKLRAPCARDLRKSNQAGGSRRATPSRTSRRSTDSMSAVSSSPECHSASGRGLRINARTRGFTIGVGGRVCGSNPATRTWIRRRESRRSRPRAGGTSPPTVTPCPASPARACSRVRNGWREHRAPSRVAQVRRHAARELLGASPVDQQRQVRAVLLDRAERQEHDDRGIAGEPRGRRTRQLGEVDHVTGAIVARMFQPQPR